MDVEPGRACEGVESVVPKVCECSEGKEEDWLRVVPTPES